MMTATTLPLGQEITGWKWEKWLDKAGEFYQNVVQLQKLRGGGESFILQAQPAKHACPSWDPYAMDIDRINLPPSEQAEHMHNHKCFICHKVGCHSSKHAGYPRGGKPPQQNPRPPRRIQATKEVDVDPWVADFMKEKEISPDQAISLLGNYYGGEGA